nr:MAG TPA: leucine-rich repeat protein [Caudoviricetes sp.]
MAIRILTKNGVENTNIDGARDCNFNAGNRDGIVKSVLKEGNFFLSSSNVIALDTCELRIFGHRIVIDTIQYKTFSSIPTTPIRYALIGQIIMTETVPSFSLIVQYAEKILQKDNINNGNGTYEVEIGRFTLQPNGTIVDLVRTLDIITGGTGSGDGSGLEIGTVTTNTLAAGLDAEVDIENRYDEEKGKTVTDFTFNIPQGESPDMGAFEAKLNENIVKDPSKTYLVWKGAAFPNSSAADFKGTAGMIVDWGDGTVETFSSVPTSAITHSYTDGVEYHLIAIENLTALQSTAFKDCDNLIKVIFGNTLTKIPINAFRSCRYLTEITIPDSVTSIGNYAFYFCNSLKNIQIPVSVLTIGDQAFESCYRLTEITIPDSITSLGSSAFSNCTGLIEVTVSKNLTSLNNIFYKCNKLVKIYMRRDTPPTITGSVLPSTLSKVIVPKTAVTYYKAATGWSNFADKIVYEVDSGDITSIPSGVLMENNYVGVRGAGSKLGFKNINGNPYITQGNLAGTIEMKVSMPSALYGGTQELVSKQGLKTINGNSIVGAGDLAISGGGDKTYYHCIGFNVVRTSDDDHGGTVAMWIPSESSSPLLSKTTANAVKELLSTFAPFPYPIVFQTNGYASHSFVGIYLTSAGSIGFISGISGEPRSEGWDINSTPSEQIFNF